MTGELSHKCIKEFLPGYLPFFLYWNKGRIRKSMKVFNGIPEDSVLGLLVLYHCDLNSIKLNGRINLFAVDTAIYNSNQYLHTPCTQINENLALSFKWGKANRLSVNVSKTKGKNVTQNHLEQQLRTNIAHFDLLYFRVFGLYAHFRVCVQWI